jgi:hypothetical protein
VTTASVDTGYWVVSRGRPTSGLVHGPDDEDRAAAEPLGRGPETEDQLADGAASPRIAIVQFLRDPAERPPFDDDLDRGVGQQIARPGVVGRSGGDEDRPVGLGDEPNRDRTPFAAPPAARPEAGESIVSGERVVDRSNALGTARRPRSEARIQRRAVGLIVAGRQRPRCQDLPSVATDGA